MSDIRDKETARFRGMVLRLLTTILWCLLHGDRLASDEAQRERFGSLQNDGFTLAQKYDAKGK